MKRLIVIILCSYVAYVGMMYAFQRNFLYLPNTSEPDVAQAKWAERIEVTTDDGLGLYGWWAAPADDAKPVLAFFHGNAGNLGSRIHKAQYYIDQGYGVLLAEYRGYGGNPGKPTEQGLYRDARAYMKWLSDVQSIDANRLVLYGESLGTGVAIEMALAFPSKALVLDVPYYSVLEMSAFRAPFVPFIEIMAKDHFRSDLKIQKVNRPVLFGIAQHDIVIPARFGSKLYLTAKEPKVMHLYEGAGHMGIYDKGFASDVIAFIEGTS